MIPSDRQVLATLRVPDVLKIEEFASSLRKKLLFQVAPKQKLAGIQPHLYLSKAIRDLGGKIHRPAQLLKEIPVLERAAMRDLKQNFHLVTTLEDKLENCIRSGAAINQRLMTKNLMEEANQQVQRNLQVLMEIGNAKRDRNLFYWKLNHGLADAHYSNAEVKKVAPHSAKLHSLDS